MKRLFYLLLLLSQALRLWASEPYTVNANSLNVREKPVATSKLIGTLTRGAVIEVESVSDGFAAFNFLGKTCYASVKFLKKVQTDSAQAAPTPKENEIVATPIAAAPSGEATIYLFFDCKHYFKQFPIDINGRHACYMEGEESYAKMTGTRYEKSYRRINIKGEGKVVLSYEVTWADKPYYNSITIDVSDGEVYYVKLAFDNMFKAIAKKRSSWEFHLMKPKEGLKELEDNKYTVNPPVDFTL